MCPSPALGLLAEDPLHKGDELGAEAGSVLAPPRGDAGCPKLRDDVGLVQLPAVLVQQLRNNT